ncbi:MAG: alkaline phosphatase family protein [Bacillota bacterium]
MTAVKRITGLVFCFLSVFFMLPGSVLALPAEVNEVKPVPPKTRQVVILVIDGLQAKFLDSGITPNISGLGMAGVKAERVGAMPPDNFESRSYTILSGTDPADHGYTKDSATPGRKTLLSYMEKKGIKTAVIDGTGRLEKACGEVSYKHFGPFSGDGAVIDAAVDVIRNKKPFFTVVVLTGPGRQPASAGADSKAYLSSVTAADNEVGKFLRHLHMDGTYEATMLIVTGTTGSPPLVIKGNEFLTGHRLPPVCLKDLAPTLGYLYGINMSGARGLIVWNALRPGADRTENFMLLQRVSDLSTAYTDMVDAAARLENEKILVQEEKTRLTRDKELVEREMAERDIQINKLNLIISVMKLAGLAGIVLFVAAMVVEYRILKKRYLFFT